jgi:SAM-dependent methyltransferase
MYGTDSAAIYDAQHRARGKDYHGEAREVARHVRRLLPTARSVLDVACGTGGHLGPFRDLFGEAEGLELAEPMLELARAAHPDLRLHHGDMRAFDLGRRFDVVTCLFASIAYVTSQDELRAALRCFARHVEPGGVVAVEPWWMPDAFVDGYCSGDVVEVDGTLIGRVTHTVRDHGASRMEVHYTLADRESGIRHFVEVHRAMLFDRDQYESAFRAAGLAVELVQGPTVQCGRGLLLGVRER